MPTKGHNLKSLMNEIKVVASQSSRRGIGINRRDSYRTTAVQLLDDNSVCRRQTFTIGVHQSTRWTHNSATVTIFINTIGCVDNGFGFAGTGSSGDVVNNDITKFLLLLGP